MVSISVVTPTLYRPDEVNALIDNLSMQTYPIMELVLVDGAPLNDQHTARVIDNRKNNLPFSINYIRHGGGTAIQRNVGIDAAKGDFVAFIDDDIRLEPDFFEVMIGLFAENKGNKIGGIAGYITNQYLDINQSFHWRVYRKLKLFKTYEPGKYDFDTGYPINRYLQPPHEGVREIDFMGTNCALWRREVIDSGLRFSEFFIGYGVLEDAHFALRAKRDWGLLECGKARCVHLHTKSGRENHRMVAKKTVTNYRYVFMSIVPERTIKQELRFWRVQFFELLRLFLFAIIHPRKETWRSVFGKFEGIILALSVNPEANE